MMTVNCSMVLFTQKNKQKRMLKNIKKYQIMKMPIKRKKEFSIKKYKMIMII